MTANAKPTGQEAEKKGFLQSLSLRTKIIAIVLLVFLVLLVVSIPGDQAELGARQDRVKIAQDAFDLAIPAVSPAIESVNDYLVDAAVELPNSISSALTRFNRAGPIAATSFQGAVSFYTAVHSLLDSDTVVPELDTDEFRALVSDMDTKLGLALIALMNLNTAIDDYNGYNNWISAKLAGVLGALPRSFTDPVPANSRLTLDSLS